MKLIRIVIILLFAAILIGCSNYNALLEQGTRKVAEVISDTQLDKLSIAESAGKQYEINAYRLANGLKVLIVEKNTAPVVSVQVWYKVGSICEKPGLKGIAHLFEHMMFRGSKNFGPEEHMRLIKEVGGISNAYTTDECTVYWETLPANKLGLALRLEADRMASLKLNKQVLDTEREVVKEEYHLRVDNSPIGSMAMKARNRLFPNHPYEFGPIGKMEDITGFTVEDCQNFFDTYYAPNNAVLIIIGDIVAQQVISQVESEFGSIPPRWHMPQQPEMSLATDQINPRSKATTELPIPVTVVAFYAQGELNADNIALKLIFHCLAEGRSSRLWKVLVEESKPAEHFIGQHISGRNNGVLYFAVAHLPGLSGKVEKKILKELEKIKVNGLEGAEFLKARNQLRSNMIFQRYHCNGLAGSIGHSEVLRGDYRLFYKTLKEIESVTQADVIRVANKYFTRDNMKVIHFNPKKVNPMIWLAGLLKSIFQL